VAWSPETNIKGPKGDKGDKGDPGASGSGTGDVVWAGTPPAVVDDIAVFNATDGKSIKDGGKKISDLVLLANLAELIDDRLGGAGGLLQAGSNITLTYNDVANTLTIAASGGSGDVTGPGGVTADANIAVYNGTTGKIIKDSTTKISDLVPAAGFAELVDDRVAALLVGTAPITVTYDDALNKITISSSGGGGGTSVTISDTAPGSPTAGALWWESDTGILYIYYAETAGSSQWVAITAGGAPSVTTTKKNYIINGAMMVSQENGATAGTTNVYYPVDQFRLGLINAGTQTVQQVASTTPGGSPNRLRVTATVADASVAAGDICFLAQDIEGSRVADLKFGLSSAKTVTVQFGVKAPAGTYCVVLLNLATNRSYVAEYVVSVGEANTDVVKSVSIPGDVAGTWPKDNTKGIEVRWGLMAGSTYQQVANSWGTGNAVGSPNQLNFMGTAGNVFELFDVSITEGTTAPAFAVPDYANELAACKRYYQKVINPDVIVPSSYGTAGAAPVYTYPLSVEMRAAPVQAVVGTWALTNCTGPTIFAAGSKMFGLYLTVTATGQYQAYNNAAGSGMTFNARL